MKNQDIPSSPQSCYKRIAPLHVTCPFPQKVPKPLIIFFSTFFYFFMLLCSLYSLVLGLSFFGAVIPSAPGHIPDAREICKSINIIYIDIPPVPSTSLWQTIRQWLMLATVPETRQQNNYLLLIYRKVIYLTSSLFRFTILYFEFLFLFNNFILWLTFFSFRLAGSTSHYFETTFRHTQLHLDNMAICSGPTSTSMQDHRSVRA